MGEICFCVAFDGLSRWFGLVFVLVLDVLGVVIMTMPRSGRQVVDVGRVGSIVLGIKETVLRVHEGFSAM